jgi:hypothetical protein
MTQVIRRSRVEWLRRIGPEPALRRRYSYMEMVVSA